jgi:predicted ATP-grasp superfamily ATP-dependent carboligase
MSLSTTSLPAADRRPDEARPIGALVVGGSHRSLALIRSLGRRGIPVAYLNDDHPIASYSRYAGRSFAWDGPGSDGAIEFLKTLARTHRLEGWVLIAAGDAELRLLSSQHHAELAAIFRMAVPPWETVRWTHDKRLTYERAAALGIDYPRCYNPRDLAEVRRSTADSRSSSSRPCASRKTPSPAPRPGRSTVAPRCWRVTGKPPRWWTSGRSCCRN